MYLNDNTTLQLNPHKYLHLFTKVPIIPLFSLLVGIVIFFELPYLCPRIKILKIYIILISKNANIMGIKMKHFIGKSTCSLLLFGMTFQVLAQGNDSVPARKSRLTLGGYGEAVYTRNFYSDNMFRYSHSEQYKESKGHGRVDLPHVVIMIGYDFGKGWSMGSEIEFEHGGVESAIEIEAEETGEFEKEIERGGEVALEQFWIQKSFGHAFNIKAGHIIVPVGLTNNQHLPTQFFTVYRSEGENTIMPCTWHETGISVWGKVGDWRYEAMIIPALNSSMFNHSGWIHDGSASAFEFKVANNLAGAIRFDNYSVPGLRMGVSGYIGNSFQNDIVRNEKSTKYKGVKGTVVIGTFDFDYKKYNWIVRGNFDYGHLSDAGKISAYNGDLSNSASAPYPHTLVGESAMAGGVEAGYDLFSQISKLKEKKHKLYLFGRYEYYDSYNPSQGAIDYLWASKHRMAVGINYFPMKEIVVKAEYSKRFLKSGYIDEPSFSLGIAYSGFFIK